MAPDALSLRSASNLDPSMPAMHSSHVSSKQAGQENSHSRQTTMWSLRSSAITLGNNRLWTVGKLLHILHCKAHAQAIDLATGSKKCGELTDCDGAGLALRGCSGVETDDGVCLITGIDLQLGLPRGEEGGQRVGGLVVRKLQVVAACALGRVQEQRSGSCTTAQYVKLSMQTAVGTAIQTRHLDQLCNSCWTQSSIL